jgi:hypothetical protein
MAHLKLEGNGLPAESALWGYFLIFEIFVRPILTVFGLLASVAVFSALVRTMNGIFSLVTENLTGFDCGACNASLLSIAAAAEKRSITDQFFFTVMYTILVYLIGTSCFKLIDQVPEGVMRWMGSGVASFADGQEPPGEKLIEYATIGANQAGGVAVQSAQTLGGMTGTLMGKLGRQRVPGTATGTSGGNLTPPAPLNPRSGGRPF